MVKKWSERLNCVTIALWILQVLHHVHSQGDTQSLMGQGQSLYPTNQWGNPPQSNPPVGLGASLGSYGNGALAGYGSGNTGFGGGGGSFPSSPGLGSMGGGYGTQFPYVSCPNLFGYQHDPSFGGWFGLIITPKSRLQQEFDLEVNMTINKAVAQSDNIKLNVLSTQDEIFHGDAIKWSIRFPYQDMLPKLTQLKFNQQVICYNHPDPLVSGVTQTAMWAKAVIRTSTGSGNQPTPYPGWVAPGSSQPSGYYPTGGGGGMTGGGMTGGGMPGGGITGGGPLIQHMGAPSPYSGPMSSDDSSNMSQQM